jgi:hypothetical protein
VWERELVQRVEPEVQQQTNSHDQPEKFGKTLQFPGGILWIVFQTPNIYFQEHKVYLFCVQRDT